MLNMHLLDFNLKELTQLVLELGQPSYRAKQLYKGLHSGLNIDQIAVLPGSFRQLLEEHYTLGGAQIYKKFVSKIDNTIKYLFLLEDSNIIEGVLMQYNHGNTICISSQVGCRMGCAFCASGINGLVRSLTAGEMLGQVLSAEYDNRVEETRAITNIVLMGSGEPLDNFDSVLKFIELVNSKEGLNIGMRNISISTCGIVPNIIKLADLKLGVNLSLSLHAPNDAIRTQIMPIAKAYTIKETLEAMKYFVKETGRRVIFEYALIDKLNDTKDCALELSNQLRGMQCHVNLIPLNSVQEKEYIAAQKGNVKVFLEILEQKGISATVRREMGADISGACGQLRSSILNKEEEI